MMKASLDTNVIIHLYRAGKQQVLFNRFPDGVYMYEQIRRVELEHHGQGILELVDEDVEIGKIQLITDDLLKSWGVLKLFKEHVNENKLLYTPQDLGEVYAISLAQIMGAHSLVSDDTKQGGPYMSLLQFEDNEIMPFTFVDVLLMNYLVGDMEATAVLDNFNDINEISKLNWNLEVHLRRFIKRFFKDPYQEAERIWMRTLCNEHQINAQLKFRLLVKEIREQSGNILVA